MNPLPIPCRTHEWLGGLFERAEFLSDRLRMLAWTNVHLGGSQCAFITGLRPGQERGNINAFPQITFIHWRNGPSHFGNRSAEHTPALQSLMRTSYALFFLPKQQFHYCIV